MKRSTLFALVFLAAMTLFACGSSTNEDGTEDPPKRIHYIENDFNGTAIIEVDGHQYLSRYHGGVTHLESCKCKTKNQ